MRASITAASAETVESPWAVTEVTTSAPQAHRSWLQRLIHRNEPSLFHRCLAIHIANTTACDSVPGTTTEHLEP
jgi:hypothetical protein